MTISLDAILGRPRSPATNEKTGDGFFSKEQELLDHFNSLVDRDRRTSAALLVAIADSDERKIWAKHGCPSMFTFCMERFHMSEQVTAKRIWAARTARRFPVILQWSSAASCILARSICWQDI